MSAELPSRELWLGPTAGKYIPRNLHSRLLNNSWWIFHSFFVRPIAGGNYDPYAESTLEGQTKLAKALESEGVVQEGDRTIGPWDCSGMTGVDCCLMIKHEVRDIDNQDNAIQCYLDYKPGTTKYNQLQSASKVRIFETNDGYVSETPAVTQFYSVELVPPKNKGDEYLDLFYD